MSVTVQDCIAFVIVAVAAVYAVIRFMPKIWRLRLASQASSFASRLGASGGAARRIEARLASGGACGSCDTCRVCATSVKEKGDEPAFAASSPPSFRRIPIRRA